ncbi:hypothetical protein B0I29_1194 [Actinoplanes lutulentus]|uniref:Uncharacterized protein n=1 Tax=Actinoplanes lutulentus TaxID=1287878 RepID=A0A327Z4W5_9ACTN|nr:hypothetical protein [Actinoplanes lutulentus]RAK28667.1 hypothetical protein B0I29_1194 [Actinoplanes lutulentus]
MRAFLGSAAPAAKYVLLILPVRMLKHVDDVFRIRIVDTRLEAVHGLFTRSDERVMQPFLDILESPAEPSNPGLVSEALRALATATVSPRLRPHLMAAFWTIRSISSPSTSKTP